VAPFIPKPHTPFQRCAQIPLEDAERNLQYLKGALRHKKISLKWQNPEMSLIEGVWSRGDRRLSALLIAAFHKGCRLDGWSDHFSFERWQDAFMETGIDPEFYTTRKRTATEKMPWDHIDSGISRTFFENEYLRALDGISTPDCRDSECSGCGICDFSTIQPVVYAHENHRSFSVASHPATLTDNDYFQYDIEFSKTGNARFFGHLELANIIQRAVRRAGLYVRYTEGFNPNMKLSFSNPLPVGMESEAESFFLFIDKTIKPAVIQHKLNAHLPDGLHIESVLLYNKAKLKTKDDSARYDICFKQFRLEPEVIDTFMKQSDFLITDTSPKGKQRTIDLRKAVDKITVLNDRQIEMVIHKYNERTIRPGEILTKGFKMPEDAVQTAVIIKKKQGA
jgi:radical SAM-linked protein